MGILDSLAGFIDNDELAEAFAVKPEDPAKVRKPLLDGIRRTQEQFAARDTGSGKAGNRWWQAQNGVVALTIKVSGGTLDLNGSATNHIPEAAFEDFLRKFEEAVGAGELDTILRDRQAEKIKSHRADNGGSIDEQRGGIAGRHPSNDRDDWDDLAWAERQKINALYRSGKNPDGSLIEVAGYQPNSPISAG